MTLSDVFQYRSALLGDESERRLPWRFSGWLWATQGQFLVALADDGREAEETPEKYHKAAHYLVDPVVCPKSVPLANLRAFVGRAVPASRTCPNCNGVGREQFGVDVVCEHCHEITRKECSRCGGDGMVSPRIRHGFIAELPVDLTLVAYALALVPMDESATMGVMQSVAAKMSMTPR
jgi:hypothetical protein